MRQLIVMVWLGVSLTGCLLDAPLYEGTEFSCAEPGSTCPQGYACIDQVCRPEGQPSDPSAPDAGGQAGPDAGPVAPDAEAPDAGLPPLTTVVLAADVIYDTQLEADDPDQNYGTRQLLRVDVSPAKTGLLRVDLSAIPPAAIIESADLVVYITEELESGQLVGYRMLEDWSELEATWYQRKAGVPWTTAGAGVGSFDPTPVAAFAAPDQGSHTVALPSALVQAWLNQSLPNYGLRWMSNSPDQRGATFYSADASSGHPTPYVRVRYREP